MDLGSVLSAVKSLGGVNGNQAVHVYNYLSRFGYLDDLADGVDELVTRIKSAQEVLGLTPDGVAGEVTLKAMKTVPRCGMKDVARIGGQTNQWLRSKANSGISYHVVRYVGGISAAKQEAILMQAWENWEKVCGVKLIRRKSTDADIIIDASASRQEEFGDAGNVLAWAYLPQGSSHTGQLIMKFDLAETWIDDPSLRGILMLNVATHEFGHLLGLDHTQIAGELMYPTYDARISAPKPRYDIPQVVGRYGLPEGKPTNPTNPPGGGEPRVEGRIKIEGIDYELRRVA